MKYTKRRFGAELILEVEKDYDIQKLSQWADSLEDFLLYGDSKYEDLDDDLIEIIRNIGAMSSDLQFEYSKQDLIDLGVNLIKEG